jgi:hypothetical protein
MRAGLSEKQEAAFRKDAPLLEAALSTGMAVASLDEEARGLSQTVSRHWRRIRPVVWVNPAKPDDQAFAWLSAGALQDTERALGIEASH